MKRIGVIALFLFGEVNAQQFTDAATMALAGADLFTVRNGMMDRNPAAITQFFYSKAGVSQLLPFSVRELSANAAYYITAVRKQPFSFDYMNSGIGTFRSHKFAVSTGKQLSEHLAVGIKMSADNFVSPDRPVRRSFMPEAGVIYRLSRKSSFAAHYIYSGRFGEDQVRSVIRAAFRYEVASYLPLFLLLEFDEIGRSAVRMAWEYQLHKNLEARLSLSSVHPYYSFGIAYRVHRFNIDASSAYHSHLGLSPCITIGYVLHKIR